MQNEKIINLKSIKHLNKNDNEELNEFFPESPESSPAIIEKISLNENVQLMAFHMNENDKAIEYFKQNPDKINWEGLGFNQNPKVMELYREKEKNYPTFFDSLSDNILSFNENDEAIEFLKEHPNMISLHFLCKNSNPKAVEIIKQHYDNNDTNKFNWDFLSSNKNAMGILKEELEKEPNKIVWNEFCKNENDEAIEYLKTHPDKINWAGLSGNKNAMSILKEELEKEPNKIVWNEFCKNENDEAIDYLKEHPKKIEWSVFSLNKNPKMTSLINVNHIQNFSALCENENAIDIIKQKLSKNKSLYQWVNWNGLSKNKNAIDLLIKITIKPKSPKIRPNHDFFNLTNVNMKGYDPIEITEDLIIEYINKNASNIVLICNTFVTVSSIQKLQKLYDTADNLVYACYNDEGYIGDGRIDKTQKYFKLAVMGFTQNYTYVNLMDMKKIFDILKIKEKENKEETSKFRIYEFVPTNQRLISVINTEVKDKPGFSVVGRSHCQEGQGGQVYTMRVITHDLLKNMKNLHFISKEIKSLNRKKNKNSKTPSPKKTLKKLKTQKFNTNYSHALQKRKTRQNYNITKTQLKSVTKKLKSPKSPKIKITFENFDFLGFYKKIAHLIKVLHSLKEFYTYFGNQEKLKKLMIIIKISKKLLHQLFNDANKVCLDIYDKTFNEKFKHNMNNIDPYIDLGDMDEHVKIKNVIYRLFDDNFKTIYNKIVQTQEKFLTKFHTAGNNKLIFNKIYFEFIFTKLVEIDELFNNVIITYKQKNTNYKYIK